jgi:hypothetical protein
MDANYLVRAAPHHPIFTADALPHWTTKHIHCMKIAKQKKLSFKQHLNANDVSIPFQAQRHKHKHKPLTNSHSVS